MNKELVLGVFFSPWFAYMGRYQQAIYHPLVNYATKGISWLLRFMQQFTCDITATYPMRTIDNRLLYLMEFCGFNYFGATTVTLSERLHCQLLLL